MPKKLTMASSAIIAIASTAPAYSLAVTIGILAAHTGVYSAAVMLIALIPMVGIAWAFKMLASKNPDSGTVFAWTTQALGPKWGFLGGFAVCIASLIVMGSLAQVATLYGLKIFGIDDVPLHWQAIIGTGWIALLTFICYKGIDITAKIQKFLVAGEILILLVFAGVALFKVYTGTASDATILPDASWFNPFGAGEETFIGIAAALFIYWGWDSSLSIAEETENSKHTPANAALWSIGITAVIYAFVVFAVISFAGIEAISGNEDDVFAVIAKDVLGEYGAMALIVAVLFSAVSSTQTTILPTARTMFSMGRAGAIPASFGKQNKETLTPEFSTVVTGIISTVLYLVLLYGGTNVIIDSVEATAIFICFYYILASISAVILFRQDAGIRIFKNVVIPVISGLMMTAVLVYSIINLIPNPEDNPFLFGNPLNIVLLASIMGLIMLWLLSKRNFFKEKSIKVIS
jgi:amino acid transporter